MPIVRPALVTDDDVAAEHFGNGTVQRHPSDLTELAFADDERTHIRFNIIEL